jgi:MFS family permease
MQAAFGSAAWIVSFATLVDNIDPQSKGRYLATAMSFATLGIAAGPVVSGTLFQLFGYWAAWSVPIVLLVVDFVARLIMIEARSAIAETSNTIPTDPEETTALLPSEQEECESVKPSQQTSETNIPQFPGFYRVILTDPRAISALANTFMLTLILAGFDATLPLFLQNTFGWDSLRVGMIFLGLQGPPILLGPIIGLLRDLFGARYTTTLGWALLFPLLWLQATPDHKAFTWAKPENYGQPVFICGLIGVGFCFLLVRGAGTFQLISMYLLPRICPWQDRPLT